MHSGDVFNRAGAFDHRHGRAWRGDSCLRGRTFPRAAFRPAGSPRQRFSCQEHRWIVSAAGRNYLRSSSAWRCGRLARQRAVRIKEPVAGCGYLTLDAKASLTLTALRMEAKEQDFYGLGNTTDRSARAGYSLRLNDFGIVLNNPLFLWSSVGFDAHFLQPRSGLSSDTGIPPARDEFNEFTAPGITTRTDFLSFRPNLKIQIPPRRSTYVGLDLGYTFYHSLSDSSRYSFRRLSATTRVVYPIHLLAKRSAIFEEVTAP